MKKLSIYIHIPFCIKKCHYCDFLSAPAGKQAQEEYLHALIGEIQTEAIKYKDYEVTTVFIGGGTPTAVSAESLCEVLYAVKDNFTVGADAEVSMEANPGTVTREALEKYRKAGINRLSIGLQSAYDEELALLGRIHTYQDFVQTYCEAREAGFTNINVDVMSALPGQSVQTYAETLNKVTDLVPPPEHISAYSLIVEEGTPFFDRYSTGESLPTEEEEREMYYLTRECLNAAGYAQYEISNYSKPNQECRHNMVYWQRGDYVGFGLGAASMVNNVRFQNVADMGLYLTEADKKTESNSLSLKEQMEEFMFLGLRLIQGVSKAEFLECFGVTVEEIYGDIIEKNKQDGLLKEEVWEGEIHILLTEKGIDISNYVMSQFLLD